jgi:Ca2+-binding RTX toxin-like protein
VPISTKLLPEYLYLLHNWDAPTGNSLNNDLQGNGGNDRLDGGTGIDTLQGGLGDDTYTIDTITDTLTEALNEGTDTVKSSVTYTLGANLENLLLTGSTAIDGTGNILNNNITGNDANNILNGGTGIDTLIGLLGDDIYLVDTTTDILTEAFNQGTDTVQSSVTYTLGINLENLTLTGSSDINGTGNALNNIITGNGANNTLAGGAGINTLIGGLGNDIYLVDTTTDILTEALNQGTDTVQSSVTFIVGTNLENLILTGVTAINGTGNTLNNTLTGNNASNFLNGLSGNDTLNGGDGNDTYIIDADVDLGIDTINETATGGQLDYLDFRTTSIGVTVNLGLTTLQTIAAGVQLVIPVVAIESVYGGSGNDALTGGQGSNELYGYDGNDSLAGDAGNDFFFGWNGDDSLNGGSGDDLFYGDTGNDTLYGGTGNDTLNGGAGNDTYIIDADVDLGIDTINDNSAPVTDIIDFRSTTTKAITLNLGLTTTQTVATGVQLIMPVANIASVYGGTGNDNLTGNNLVNYLMGGIGNDTLAGGEGNDIYLIDADVDTGIDSIIETGGIDTLDFRSTTTKGVTVNLAINATPLVQTIAPGVQLSMSTTPIEYVYGGTGNDNITGNNSDNYLIGGIGNDSLTGGSGNDTYVIDADVDTGTDSIIETATGGIDTLNFGSTTTKAITLNLGTTIVQTIATGVQLTMPTGAIEDVYGGTGNDNLTGNTLNNRLYGLSGNNQLFGLSGNDQLYGGSGSGYGGSGNDTLTGGDGNDSLYGDGGDDLLNGGNGVDSFYFKITGLFLGSALTGNKTVANIFGRDTISDFTVGVDKIILSKSNFTAINSAVGTSIGTNFSKVANELSVDTQFASIVYCQGNGNLYYNQNGNAIGLGTNGGNLAVLTGLPALTANDFVIA